MGVLATLLVLLTLSLVLMAVLAYWVDQRTTSRNLRRRRVAAMENALANIEHSARTVLAVNPSDVTANAVTAEINRLRRKELR